MWRKKLTKTLVIASKFSQNLMLDQAEVFGWHRTTATVPDVHACQNDAKILFFRRSVL